jgi:flagellar protein FliO/FliZ
MTSTIKTTLGKRLSVAAIFLSVTFAHRAKAETASVVEPVFGAANVLQVVLSLALILCLVVALAWLVKRMQTGTLLTDKHQMKVLSALNLGGRERLLLVQVGEQHMLIGVAPGNVSYIKSVEPAVGSSGSSESDSVKNNNGFFNVLNKVREQSDSGKSDV